MVTSDTPRTDELVADHWDRVGDTVPAECYWQMARLAKELELELEALNHER